MAIIGIYKITNPKGKIYIGQSINVEDRIKKYKYLNSYSTGNHLLNSLKKYGYKNHKFEIIESCEIFNLSIREKYWIKYYNSINEGLNIIDGGSSVGFKKGNVKEKISKTWKNKSPEEMDAINEKRRQGNLGKKKPGAGCKSFTKEHREKLSQSSKGKPKIKNQIPVLMLDKINNTILKEFKSITEAANFIGVKQPTLSGCLTGKAKTSGGYKWKYKVLPE
jgi:group I intron endonuclease